MVDRVGGIYVQRFGRYFILDCDYNVCINGYKNSFSWNRVTENLKFETTFAVSIVGLLVIPLVTIQWDYTRIMRN